MNKPLCQEPNMKLVFFLLPTIVKETILRTIFCDPFYKNLSFNTIYFILSIV